MALVAAPLRPRGQLAHPLWQTYQWEMEKLTAQFRTRAVLAICLLGPIAFAVGLQLSPTVPSDTLFGRWVGTSGYSIPLVVLGFAGSWGFPLVTCLVAGDIFSAEDHYGTWTSLLTRSASRGSIFCGKVFAAMTYASAFMALLTTSSLMAGVLIVGDQPMIGLSGNVVSSTHALMLVLVSWAVALPGVLVAGTLGMAVSILTRNSLAGIVLPTVIGLVLELLLLVSGLGPLPRVLPNASFVAWHGLWASPAFAGPLITACIADMIYVAILLFASWWVFRRRDVTAT